MCFVTMQSHIWLCYVVEILLILIVLLCVICSLFAFVVVGIASLYSDKIISNLWQKNNNKKHMETSEYKPPHPNCQRQGFLRRSVSLFSSPVRKKICIEDKLLSKPNGYAFVKSYSCEQVLEGGKIKYEEKQVCVVGEDKDMLWSFLKSENQLSNKSSCKRKNSKKKSLVKSLPPIKCEPVDKKKPLKWWLGFVLLPLLLVCACIVLLYLLMDNQRRFCQMELVSEVLEQSFKDHIFGQEQALREIISTFQTFSKSKDSKIEVMIFNGGTGVGKSYAASLIINSFMWPDNVQHLVMPVQGRATMEEIRLKLSYCGDNLIVVDGLNTKDALNYISFVERLSNISNRDKFRVIVILIFNSQQQSGNYIFDPKTTNYTEVIDRNTKVIEETFMKCELNTHFINFLPLSKNHITLCIKEAIFQRDVADSVEHVDHLLSVLLPLQTGCKGITSKVNLLV